MTKAAVNRKLVGMNIVSMVRSRILSRKFYDLSAVYFKVIEVFHYFHDSCASSKLRYVLWSLEYIGLH